MKALIRPHFEPNGFVLLMKLTMTKYSYKHLLDLTPIQQKAKQKVKVQLSV